MAKIIQAEGSGTIKVRIATKNFFLFLKSSSYHLLPLSIISALFFYSKVGKLIAVMAEDGEEWKEVAQTAGENNR